MLGDSFKIEPLGNHDLCKYSKMKMGSPPKLSKVGSSMTVY